MLDRLVVDLPEAEALVLVVLVVQGDPKKPPRREYPGEVRQSNPTVPCECRYVVVLPRPGSVSGV